MKKEENTSKRKIAIIAAVIAGISMAVIVGVIINSTVPRNSFASDVIHPAQSVTVVIPQNAWDSNGNATFSPKEITVVLGVNNTVVWENHSVNPERVIGADEYMPGGFGKIKGLIEPERSWGFTFTEEGTYNYLSEIHPWLTGTVTVKRG